MMCVHPLHYECLECRKVMELIGVHVVHPDPVPNECIATMLGVPFQVVKEGAPTQ